MLTGMQHPLSMWDIAAGIIIGLGLIGAVAYGLRQSDRGVTVIFGIVMAAIVIWRSSCWYYGLACDVPTGKENLASIMEAEPSHQ